MNRINTKTLSRLAAIQAIYQLDANDDPEDISIIVNNIIEYYNLHHEQNNELSNDNLNKAKIAPKFFKELINSFYSNINEIDKVISSNLKSNWNMSSLHTTLLSILRTGICEILYIKDTPSKVVISEYTTIASDLLSGGEEDFVNAILDKISKNQK